MRYRLLWFISALLLSAPSLFVPAAFSQERFETFLEPYRLVELMPAQREKLVKLEVSDGESVKKGQLLGIFDSRVLQARLDLLKTAAAFEGSVNSAQALVSLRKSKLTILEDLARSGNARPQEIETARTNLVIAEAQLQEVLEGIAFNKAEQQVMLAQIDQKRLYSPIDGVVVKINQFEGELVGGQSAQPILTVGQLDPLIATFHLSPERSATLEQNGTVTLYQGSTPIAAEVIFISPIIEAQSGTILVQMQIANSDGTLVSGSRISYRSN